MPCQQPSVGILAIDDNSLVLDGLERWISRTPGFEWIGGATDPARALELLQERAPQAVLLDFEMPGHDTMALIRTFQDRCPTAAVVILSGSTRAEDIAKSIDAGAQGYVVKDARFPDIADMIRAAIRGEFVLSTTAKAAIAGCWVG